MQSVNSDNDQQCFKPHESEAKNVLLTSGEILSPISGRRSDHGVITDDSCDYFITVVIIIMTVIVLLMIIVVIITITKFSNLIGSQLP